MLTLYTFICVRASVLDEICNFNLSWIQNNVSKTDAEKLLEKCINAIQNEKFKIGTKIKAYT